MNQEADRRKAIRRVQDAVDIVCSNAFDRKAQHLNTMVGILFFSIVSNIVLALLLWFKN